MQDNNALKMYDTSIEKELLGSLLINGDLYEDISSIVQQKDFYDIKHIDIYGAIRVLGDRGNPIDIVSVSDFLGRIRKLDGVGGSAYLTSICVLKGNIAHATYYAEQIAKYSYYRKVSSRSADINKLLQKNLDADELSLGIEKLFDNITPQRKQDLHRITNEDWDEIFEYTQKLRNNEAKRSGVSTGIRDWDYRTGGMQREEVLVLAAKSSHGKSALALQIAHNIAKQNKPVLIFSLEMSERQLKQRLLAIRSRQSLFKIRQYPQDFSEDQFNAIKKATDELKELPIDIFDGPTGVSGIKRMISSAVKKYGELGLVVVDHLQIVTQEESGKNTNDQIGIITRELHFIAKQFNIPILLLSQLSRDVDRRTKQSANGEYKFQLSDLRDSGNIEQDAESVLFLSRPDITDRTDTRVHIQILKQRNGPTGKFQLVFNPDPVDFSDKVLYDEYNQQDQEQESDTPTQANIDDIDIDDVPY